MSYQSVIDQIAKLSAYLGVTDLLSGLLANPLATIIVFALIVRYLASGPIKEVEGVDKLWSLTVDKLF